MNEWQFVSRSPADTRAIGERLGRAAEAGDVIAMFGGLGAGKTVLTKGIIGGLGGDPDHVTSPTFILMMQHRARLPLFHFDAYRLGGPREFLDIGAEEAFYGPGVSVVEWAERVEEVLPPHRLDIRLEVESETERRIVLTPRGPRAENWARQAREE